MSDVASYQSAQSLVTLLVYLGLFVFFSVSLAGCGRFVFLDVFVWYV